MTDPKNPVETIEFLDAMLKSWEMYGKIMEDKKVNIADFPTFLAGAPYLYKGFIGFDKIDDELKVVDADGRALINAKVAEFVLADNAELEVVVENLLALVLDMVETAAKTVAYFKTPKFA